MNRIPAEIEELFDKSDVYKLNEKLFEITSSFKYEICRIKCFRGRENDEYYKYYEYNGTTSELAEELKIEEWRIYKINHKREFSNRDRDVITVALKKAAELDDELHKLDPRNNSGKECRELGDKIWGL